MADNTYENSPVAENKVTESVMGKKKDFKFRNITLY